MMTIDYMRKTLNDFGDDFGKDESDESGRKISCIVHICMDFLLHLYGFSFTFV